MEKVIGGLLSALTYMHSPSHTYTERHLQTYRGETGGEGPKAACCAGGEGVAVSRRGHPERVAEGEAVLLVVASWLEKADGGWAAGAGGNAVRPPVAGSWGERWPKLRAGEDKGW